jgi:FtsH-binding integral membrane protein
MSWFWWFLGVMVVVLWVVALVDIIRRRHSRSGGQTATWLLITLIFPVLGTIVYFLVNGAAPPGPPRDPDVMRATGGPY